MNLTTQLSNRLIQKIRESGRSLTEITSAKPVSGGSINNAYKLQTDGGPFFLKTNHASRYPRMFEAEAKGLQLLSEPKALRVPKPIATDSLGEEAFILMEFIAEGSANTESHRALGEGLANLHQHSNDHFGLDHDNYIGSLPQSNSQEETWPDFFAARRIEPQLKMAESGSYFTPSERKQFDKLLSRWDSLVPKEGPALIHGDLWSGNYLYDSDGRPVLIDPAVYYGHREMDIAMMHLFGGFRPEVFEAYNSTFPMEKGWKERIDLHNLYPLLVHVNLFGAGYAGQVKSVLRKFR